MLKQYMYIDFIQKTLPKPRAVSKHRTGNTCYN